VIFEYIRIFKYLQKKYGFRIAVKEVRYKLRKMLGITHTDRDRKMIEQVLAQNRGKRIIVFPPVIDWHVPLFQRPQHLAIELARSGFLYFFCSPNLYDDIAGLERFPGSERLYLTNRYDLLREYVDQNWLFHIYAQDPGVDEKLLQHLKGKGVGVLYEYIDELHPDLNTSDQAVLRRHVDVLKDESITVVATAQKLFSEVLGHRLRNCLLVTNGVDYGHFAKTFTREQMPLPLRPLVDSGRPIIGYFGALASWFDYDLVIMLAKERPDYSILLIGWNYDGSLASFPLDRYPNITVVGPIDYRDLPGYACWFDVATIPFRINAVTESTSPIKLFEYMAMGKPIVTTGIPECRKYHSVLIGENHAGFISQVDTALQLRGDAAYMALLKQEALENTWKSKAMAIKGLIEGDSGR